VAEVGDSIRLDLCIAAPDVLGGIDIRARDVRRRRIGTITGFRTPVAYRPLLAPERDIDRRRAHAVRTARIVPAIEWDRLVLDTMGRDNRDRTGGVAAGEGECAVVERGRDGCERSEDPGGVLPAGHVRSEATSVGFAAGVDPPGIDTIVVGDVGDYVFGELDLVHQCLPCH
jgi:hypothetical protein